MSIANLVVECLVMPWQKTDPVLERVKFIAALLNEPNATFAELCARFGVSRMTGYRWKKRFENEGPSGLEDRPSVARRQPNATAVEVEDAIVEMRKRYSTWGPKKIRRRLSDTQPELGLPALSTIGAILRRRGMIAPRRRRVLVPPSTTGLSTPEHPNALWTADHKGDFKLEEGRCYPLTICDARSRYVLKCEALPSTRTQPSRLQFEHAFREFGLPDRIRSDNGTPFASTALGGLSRLSVWWVKLGIELERIRPGHPEENGAHERMHRTLKAEAVQTGINFAEQQRRFDEFRLYFNHIRPHEGIDMDVPAQRYETSWRPYPSVVSSPEYPGMKVRRVQSNGSMHWKGKLLRIGKIFAGEPVGLEEVDDARWLLHFGSVQLAGIDGRGDEITVVRDLEGFAPRTP